MSKRIKKIIAECLCADIARGLKCPHHERLAADIYEKIMAEGERVEIESGLGLAPVGERVRWRSSHRE